MARAFALLPLRQRGAFFGGVWTGEYGRAGAAHTHIGLRCDGLHLVEEPVQVCVGDMVVAGTTVIGLRAPE